MVSSRTITEVQSLNGKLAALGRFLARSAERSLPFFKTLKGCMNKKDFRWNNEAEEAFQELKAYLKSLPALTVPTPGEELILYLAATREAISSVLMTERDHIQKPIYFKGRLAKWAIELGEHDITYKPRTTVKGQILADFVAESTINGVQDITSPIPQRPTDLTSHTWTLYTDGASSNDGSGAGLILTDPHENEVTYALRFDFPTSNNEAEYEALIAGLELATRLKVSHLKVFCDSLLITNHVKGTYKAREDSMKHYLAKTQRLLENFKSFSITQIPRSKNKRADALSNLASSSFAHLTKNVLVEVKPYRSINAKEAEYVLQEAHFGSCGSHSGARTLTQKAARLGYYWPTKYSDATKLVKACRNCQEHAPVQRKPHCNMTSISSPWPFYQWGIDLVGPFPEAPGRVKFLVVAVDYFTKWVEAEPLATINDKNILKFVWKNIVCRFGNPGIIISDKGKQFAENPFRDWCQELHIQQKFTLVAHPQANAQTEVTNRTLLQGLKTRLGNTKGLWVEELPNVLWAYRTTARTGNNCTPFSLVYGSEAVLPPEIGLPTFRIHSFENAVNNDELRLNLDLLEERREISDFYA
ncbi:reverse transcriptase domain-containing protein [Tanacetum coccineum]